MVSLCPYSPSELEELRQALKWTQHCLTDSQSQQDVDLIMQLLVTEDFRNAYSIFTAVSQQKSRVSPTSPPIMRAEDLCQEVGTVPVLLVYLCQGWLIRPAWFINLVVNLLEIYSKTLATGNKTEKALARITDHL